MWDNASGYEAYVGHWSRLIAPRFLDWLGLPPGLEWLDVACGTGAVASAILARCQPAAAFAVDGSRAYIARAAANCRGSSIRFQQGDATTLPFGDRRFDAVVSGLALNFVPVDRALAEQRRVVRGGGTVAAYVWDYGGEYEFARRFWDAALSIDARAAAHDPARTATICTIDALEAALGAAGFTAVQPEVFDDSAEFPTREAYWSCFDGRQGTTAEYLGLLSDAQLRRLKETVLSTLPPAGPVRLRVRALAIKGRRA